MKNQNRKIIFYLPSGQTLEFEQGKESPFGVVETIWFSKESHDAFIRVTTSLKTMTFKCVPYMLVEDKQEDRPYKFRPQSVNHGDTGTTGGYHPQVQN